MSFCVSPLHDKDINPTGEVKKSHYHIILCYDGPTTYNNVKTNITDVLNQPIPIPLEQVRGYYRYLTHKDNPEKYQYSDTDIQVFNGFDISDYDKLTYSQIQSCIIEIQKIIIEMKMCEYSQLLNYLLFSEQYTLLDVAYSHTILFNSYLASIRHSSSASS